MSGWGEPLATHERFEAMKREGQLEHHSQVARKLVDHALSADFGPEPATDLRALFPAP